MSEIRKATPAPVTGPLSGSDGRADGSITPSSLAGELAFAVMEAPTLDEALAVALRRTCEVAGFVLGQAWAPSEDARVMECSAASHIGSTRLLPFRAACEATPLAPGQGIVGRAWSTRRPAWISDPREDPSFTLAPVARAVDLGSGVAVPVVPRSEVAIVLEFFDEARGGEPRPEIDLVAGVATLVGSLVERQRSEHELRRSEQRYRLLAENATDVISVTDVDGVLKYVSPASTAVNGYEPQELIGRSGWDFVHPEDVERVQAAHVDLFARDEPVTAPPYRTRRRDGSYVWIESTARPIRDPQTGAMIGVQSSARDVTQRKLAEDALTQAYEDLGHANRELARTNLRLGRANAELERSNSDLERFAYEASHDLGQPLRVMEQLLRRLVEQHGKGLDEEAIGLCTAVLDGLDRMQCLIDDLLTYSRVSSEPLTPGRVDCTAVVEEACGLLAEAITAGRATVESGPLPTVDADPTQVAQLFRNLLSNALKFAVDGTRLRVRISATREAAAWCFTVEDNGIGIDSQHAERVFGMFQRLHPVDAYPGSGIGLSICKRIVERHGGRIWVEPADSGGSAFRFTLPDRRAPATSPDPVDGSAR